MALNSLEFAQKFSSELDKIVVQKSNIGFLADNVMKANFVGAKTVLIPGMEFQGLADYDRDNGFPKGKVTVTNESYELTKDRGRSFQIDRMDMDETGIANLAGQTLKEFARTKVVPEMDAYAISKLAGVAKNDGIAKTFDASKAFAIFNEMATAIQAKAGYDEDLVCFMNSVAYSALMNSPEISRQVVVSDFKQGEINLKVKKLNDIAIIPVADNRMKTQYTFGTDGFEPTGDAENVNMLMLAKDGASLVKKTETMRIFAPEKNTDADAYIFQYRLYYDVFVKKSRLEHIAVATSAQ